MKPRHFVAGAIAAAAVGSVSPVVPASMAIEYSYQVPVANQVSATDASSTPPVFSDTDGSGVVSVSVFKNRAGKDIYLQIPNAKYVAMGTRGGIAQDPTDNEMISPIEALTTDAEAAVAYDNGSATRVGSATSLTYAVTVGSTGNEGIVVQAMQNSGSDNNTGITYNGSALTKLNGYFPAGFMWVYEYAGYAPTMGSNNVVVTDSSTSFIASAAMVYSGIAQSGNFTGFTTSTASSVTSLSDTVTTTADNSYVVGFGEVISGANPSAGTATIRRVINTSDGNSGFDSNAVVTPAGARAIQMTVGSSDTLFMQAFAVAPVPPPPAGVQMSWKGVQAAVRGVQMNIE